MPGSLITSVDSTSSVIAPASPPTDGTSGSLIASADSTKPLDTANAIGSAATEKVEATKTPTQKATQQEDKEVNQQTNIKTTSTITENGKGNTLTIVLRFPKDATMQSTGDGDTAQQLLMSFDGKGGRKKNKKNLTKKRHRKNT
jgi:hypothetical protein